MRSGEKVTGWKVPRKQAYRRRLETRKGKGKEKGGNKQKNGARAAKQEKEEDGNRE